MPTTETIAKALRIVAANDIQTEDGVIEACLRQAANRLEELEEVNAKLVEALANTIATASPLFSDDVQLLTLQQARAALALAKGE